MSDNETTRSKRVPRSVLVTIVLVLIGTGALMLQSCGGSKNDPKPQPTENPPPPT
jgi:hypothetical protein